MKQKNNALTGIVLLLLFGSIVYFVTTQLTVFQVSPQTIIEYVRPASCNLESFVCNHPYQLKASGGYAKIDGYEIITELKDFGFRKTCETTPPKNHDGTPAKMNGDDSNGCPVWKYTEVLSLECCSPIPGSLNQCCEKRIPGVWEGTVCSQSAEHVGVSPPSCNPKGLYRHTTSTFGIVERLYGGLKSVDGSDRFGCWEAVTVKKDGKVLFADRTFDDGTRDLTYHANSGSVRVLSFDNLTVRIGASVQGDSRSCVLFNNHYFYEPVQSNDLLFNISLPTDVLQGDEIVTLVSVDNRNGMLFGNLMVKYEAPSIIGGVERVDKQLVSIPFGKSMFNFSLEGRYITERLRVTPSLELLLDKKHFVGVNVPDLVDGKLRSVEEVAYYRVGVVSGDTAVINVESLAERVRALQQEKTTLQEEKSLLQQEKESLQTAILDNVQRINELRGQKVEQERVIAELLIQIDALNATAQESIVIIDSLQLSTAEKQREIVRLTNLIEDQKEKIVLMQRVVEELELDYAGARDTILLLRSQLETADDRIDFLLLTVDDLELSNSEVADLLNSYEASLDEDARLISELTDRNYELSTLLDSFDPEQVPTLLDEIKRLEAEKQRVEGQFVSLITIVGVFFVGWLFFTIAVFVGRKK